MIYKIAHAADWRDAARSASFDGSAKDREDGFIHFSTAAQLAQTLRLYYPNAKDLLLVAVDEAALGTALKWEHAPSRGEDFPHLYGALPLSAVRWARPIPLSADGVHLVPLDGS